MFENSIQDVQKGHKVMRLGVVCLLLAGTMLFSAGCGKKHRKNTANGVFEATEIIVSSESNGKMLNFDIEEGQTYEAGTLLGCIDTFQTYLQIKQLESSINATLARRPNMPSQMRVLEDKLATLGKEERRVQNLLKADAASTKQLEDIQAEIKKHVQSADVPNIKMLTMALKACRFPYGAIQGCRGWYARLICR